MSDPGNLRAELDAALEVAATEARAFLAGLDDDPVQPTGSEDAVVALGGALPEEGEGAPVAVRELASLGRASATRSAGPRFFHFVIGGATPAALAADWLTSSFDQNAGAWVGSPFGSHLESICVEWLRDLFDLPSRFGGVLVTGGTMANFVCLAVARDWCAARHGVRAREVGLASTPQIPVFSSGYIHASATKSLALLGVGTSNVHKLTRDAAGRLDLDALERSLAGLDGAPAIVVANAGEVNAGDFDPIDAMADLTEEHDAWLHVDGAFGLFARISPRSAHLAAGTERAGLCPRTATSGSMFRTIAALLSSVMQRAYHDLLRGGGLPAAFGRVAAQLGGSWGPRARGERARSRSGRRFAPTVGPGTGRWSSVTSNSLSDSPTRIDAEPELERLAEVPLNIVCFRWRPANAADSELDELNRRLGEALLRDGRVFAGTTVFEGKVAFRPAIVNWRSRPEDVDALIDGSSSSVADYATSWPALPPAPRLRAPLRGSGTPQFARSSLP